MTLFQALVLGVLQGVAEFLPISSSAHLALAPWLFGWPEPGLSFDVALHVGTLVAVLGYFRAEWIRLARAALEIVRTRKIETVEQQRAVFLVIATIPGGDRRACSSRSTPRASSARPWLIAVALIVMGLVLWVVDRAAPETRPLGAMTRARCAARRHRAGLRARPRRLPLRLDDDRRPRARASTARARRPSAS